MSLFHLFLYWAANSSQISMAYPCLFSGNSAHKNAVSPLYQKYCINLLFLSQASLISLLLWIFPCRQETVCCHSCFQWFPHYPCRLPSAGFLTAKQQKQRCPCSLLLQSSFQTLVFSRYCRLRIRCLTVSRQQVSEPSPRNRTYISRCIRLPTIHPLQLFMDSVIAVSTHYKRFSFLLVHNRSPFCINIKVAHTLYLIHLNR